MTKENLRNPKSNYDGLLEAIDFFSQKFNTEQLSSFAIDFASKLLGINKLCLFTMKKDRFEAVKKIGYDFSDYEIKDSERLQHIATFYGSIMTIGFEMYFEEKDIKTLNMGFVFPLIIQDHLLGFLVSTPEATAHLEEEEIALARALMQIINNSLENSYNYVKLSEKKKKLDREVFNLFSINQSSKALLSVLNLDSLYQLSIDIFSELTSSGVTSFGLYDEINDAIILRGYKNVHSKKSIVLNFRLKQRSYDSYKIVFHKERDREKLEEIFENFEDFNLLDAEYVVLIVKETILGFVTLGKTINDTEYDESVFELIESLASATYISFKNAIYFNEINRQKALAEEKFKTLIKLNKLMKNLNSCETIEELCELACSTIDVGFGIKKALLAVYEENETCQIKSEVGFEPRNRELKINDVLRQELLKGPVIEFIEADIRKYFEEELIEDLKDINCLVISPISMMIDSLGEHQSLGYIMVFETPDILKEEEVLLLDTISKSIAPTLYHMQERDRVKQNYMVDEKQAFITALEKRFTDMGNYDTRFYLYGKRLKSSAFEEIDLDDFVFFEKYYFEGMLIVLSDYPIEGFEFAVSLEPKDMEEVKKALQDM